MFICFFIYPFFSLSCGDGGLSDEVATEEIVSGEVITEEIISQEITLDDADIESFTITQDDLILGYGAEVTFDIVWNKPAADLVATEWLPAIHIVKVSESNFVIKCDKDDVEYLANSGTDFIIKMDLDPGTEYKVKVCAYNIEDNTFTDGIRKNFTTINDAIDTIEVSELTLNTLIGPQFVSASATIIDGSGTKLSSFDGFNIFLEMSLDPEPPACSYASTIHLGVSTTLYVPYSYDYSGIVYYVRACVRHRGSNYTSPGIVLPIILQD